MKHNPAMRTLAKICLNSLWGRFSLRNHLSKTEIINDPAVLRSFYDDNKLEISGLHEINDDYLMLSYYTKKEFIEEHNCSNVIISLWTTSAARLHLLKVIHNL